MNNNNIQKWANLILEEEDLWDKQSREYTSLYNKLDNLQVGELRQIVGMLMDILGEGNNTVEDFRNMLKRSIFSKSYDYEPSSIDKEVLNAIETTIQVLHKPSENNDVDKVNEQHDDKEWDEPGEDFGRKVSDIKSRMGNRMHEIPRQNPHKPLKNLLVPHIKAK